MSIPQKGVREQASALARTAGEAIGLIGPRTKRRVCFLITNRIHYARQEILLKKLRDDPDVDLQLVVGGSALLEKYSEVPAALARHGFEVHEEILNLVEGGNHAAMAKSAGLMVLELANTFQKLNPDIVLIRGDRFEMLAAAMTAAYLNKTVAHIEGGDLSGTIDESVRHAITKLAHIHFATNEASQRRLVQMGENPEYVFHVGSPDVEFALEVKRVPDEAMRERIGGVGGAIDFSKPYILVIQHPVTSEAENREHVLETLKAVSGLGVQALWFWPNPDAGTDAISKGIRTFREQHPTPHIRFVIDLFPRDFIALLRNSACLIGNSSSGIKEASIFGVPVVNIGTRQNGRTRGPNVRDVGYDASIIRSAIEEQVRHGFYPPDQTYFKPGTAAEIVRVLKTVPLYTQKHFRDIGESAAAA